MKYNLQEIQHQSTGYLRRLWSSGKELLSYLNKRRLGFALILVILSSISQIITPYLLGSSIDKYISRGDIRGLFGMIIFLFILYLVTGILAYYEQNIIGQVGQTALYKLRNTIFEKIQSLPLAFFNQNKVGDLMSRINNDTEKLSEFLSESIIRAVGSIVILVGVGSFILYLNFKLGAVLLAATVFLVIFTRVFSPLVERKSRESSVALGFFTSGVSEQLANFKAIIAFDRRNFFEKSLRQLNENIYRKSLLAGFLSKLFEPIFDAAGNISQIAVLIYGVYLITQGQLTIGLLIGFINYALRFYNPLQYFAQLFGEMQSALASWGRIRDLLSLTSDMVVIKDDGKSAYSKDSLMSFEKMSFGYTDKARENLEDLVLEKVSVHLDKGKTYALVGPTGGGKTTMANLMARLYDPVAGIIFWKGKDIRSYDREGISNALSVILQEPYLFSGTVGDNIRYGNRKLEKVTDDELEKIFEEKDLEPLIKRFPEGIKTKVESGGENISIGQKQLISFVRTLLRQPEFIILDEATANIDTVTEKLLQHLIDIMPADTTKVIIAHRLNTIKKADEILFIGGGEVKQVADSAEVLKLLSAAAKA